MSLITVVGVVAALVGIAACDTVPVHDGTAATNEQINSAHTGVSTTRISATPRVLWSKQFSGGGGPVGAPLIIGDLVIVAVNADVTDPPKTLAAVYAFDRLSGKEQWVHVMGDDLQLDLAYGGSRVIVYGNRSQLSALNVKSGAVVWKTDLAKNFLPPPTVLGGQILISATDFHGYDRLTSYAVSTGAVNWSTVVDNTINATPTATSDGVYLTGDCDLTKAVRPSDGALLWTRTFDCYGGGGGRAVVRNGRVYASDFGSDYAPPDPTVSKILDQKTGTPLGTYRTDIPAIVGTGNLIVGTANWLQDLTIDGKTTRWTYRLKTGEELIGQPIVAGSNVYAVVRSGAAKLLVTIPVSTGKETARLTIANDLALLPAGNTNWRSSMAAANGVLAIAGPFGTSGLTVIG